MKTSLICTGIVLALALFSMTENGPVGRVEAASAPEAEMVLQGKKPARFSHTTHTAIGIECGACHHDQAHAPLTAEAIAALTDAASLRCLSCHNEQHPKEGLRQAKDVFHGRCKTCHQEGWQGKTGPTKCTDCHLKAGSKAAEGC